MCESIPSVTLWGTTQLTTLITTSTVLTTQVAQSTRLATNQITTREVITSLVPQQTLYYPCSDSESGGATAPRPSQSRIVTSQNEEEGSVSVDPNATGQFTGSLPTQTRRLSFTSPPVRSTSIPWTSISPIPSTSSSVSTSSMGAGGDTDSSQSNSTTTKSSNAGAIAGAVVGGIFGLILLIVLLMCCQKRRARRRRIGSAGDEDWNDHSGKQGGGNDYWERRFREMESANSSRGNGLGLNGMGGGEGRGEEEKGDWDSQTSRKLRLTLDLGSKDLPSRPPSRLSMISSFFGVRMTPTPNIMASPYHRQHTRTGSTPTLRSTFGNQKRRPSTKGSAGATAGRFSFNPFRRHQPKQSSYGSDQFLSQTHFPQQGTNTAHVRGSSHGRSLSSPWIQEDSRSSKSTTTGTGGGRSAGYSNSNKSPGFGTRPSLEDGYGNVNRSGSKSTHNTAHTQDERHSQSTFGKKMSSFDQPAPIKEENNNFQYGHVNSGGNANMGNGNVNNNNNNSWNHQPSEVSSNTVQPPPQAITINTQNTNTNANTNTSGLPAVREGRVIESPTEEEIEERRNMEWIRHSTLLSEQGEGEETLDHTDEEKLKELKSQLGIDDLDGLGLPDISIFKNLDNPNYINPPKPYLGFGQFNPSIGNTPPQLGAIGTYTSSNSHLSGISTIPSLPPATTRGGYSSGISSVGSSSFIPFVPPPRGPTNSHLSTISSTDSNTLPFIPPIRGGHGSVSGLSITPSTVLPRGYLSGLSSAHSFTNRTLRPKSPDSVSIPSDIIINNGPGGGLQRNNSQSTVSSYSTHPVSPYSTQPSFGVSRPNSQFSDVPTNNRNTRTLTVYRPERGSNPNTNGYPPVSRRSSSIKLKRTPSGRVISSIVVRDSSLLPPMPMGMGNMPNRKSAFQVADEDQDMIDIPAVPLTQLPVLPIPEKIPSPPPTSFLIPENINRRSLKRQRESKGKHVPTIRLSQRALTPSLWIDEELLARFAASQNDEEGSYVTFDDGSTVKPTPVSEKNNHLRDLETKSRDRDSAVKKNKDDEDAKAEKAKYDQLDTEERPLISRFSNSTVQTISRNNSLASTSTASNNGTTSTCTVERSSTVISSKSQNGSVSRLNSSSDLNVMGSTNLSTNQDQSQDDRPITPSRPINITEPAKSDSYLLDPTSLTPRPKRKQSFQSQKSKTKGKGKGKEREIHILSPHTPPNKLPLFSPPFPKPPTPPLPFSEWVQGSNLASSSSSALGGGKDFRFSIKQRRKNQQNGSHVGSEIGAGQGQFQMDDEGGNGKSVVTPQLPFLTLGSLSTNSSVTDLNLNGNGNEDWKKDRKKSAYEDADEGENEFIVDRI
ncbi:hypothetical protein I302_102879 [Kwoniella bestiolae CBS 10118]|uniref:Uncharacterized protein n=1 Tax=Kwoniella bestiolae CBS 10118 TaxID=1296100 RepID=A0A1B9GGH2_9TREE|nr:hypothetical protein I302_01574 [Kwoniella bestiolae CBS 10118]OCF30055.1 hypothetical protein I302_01574 [Kwoniella bestiolae CBS 10118]